MIGLEYVVKEFQMEYKEVAKDLGISPQTMQDWLKGRRKIPVKRVGQLSKMFNLPETYFQKELTFTEKGEVTIRFLETISEAEEIPVIVDEGEMEQYYKKGTYEDEIEFLKETMAKKKKQHNIRKSLEELIKDEAVLSYNEFSNAEDPNEPLLNDSSNIETFSKVISIMADEKLARNFKVMVHLLHQDDELGGKPIKQISPEYRDFGKDFLDLLKKHKI